VVILLVPEPVKANSKPVDVRVMPADRIRAFPLPSCPAIVKVLVPLIVKVFVYPVKFRDLQFMVELEVQGVSPVPTPSKIASSEVVGTLALS